jgi:hypothetical protein
MSFYPSKQRFHKDGKLEDVQEDYFGGFNRTKVFGGWLVWTYSTRRGQPVDVLFIPDLNHEWEIIPGWKSGTLHTPEKNGKYYTCSGDRDIFSVREFIGNRGGWQPDDAGNNDCINSWVEIEGGNYDP